MTSKLYINETIRYLILFFFHIFVFKLLSLEYYGSIMIFPLFILMLPTSISTTALLFIAFFTGIILDVLEFHPGLYTSSLLFIALIKHFWFKMLQPPFYEEKEVNPNDNSISWLILYISIPILLFELIYSIELKLEFSTETILFAIVRSIFDFIFSFLFLNLLYR